LLDEVGPMPGQHELVIENDRREHTSKDADEIEWLAE
jgi:hypothetical protein